MKKILAPLLLITLIGCAQNVRPDAAAIWQGMNTGRPMPEVVYVSSPLTAIIHGVKQHVEGLYIPDMNMVLIEKGDDHDYEAILRHEFKHAACQCDLGE